MRRHLPELLLFITYRQSVWRIGTASGQGCPYYGMDASAIYLSI